MNIYDKKIPVRIKKTAKKSYPPITAKVPKVQKVEVTNPVEQKEIKFPEVQKVEITNKPIDIQKVEVTNQKEIVIPEIQKVEVTNQVQIPELKLPDIQKVEITNPTPFPELKVPDIQKVELLNEQLLPIGKGNDAGQADPEYYVPVRLTDGKKFYRALEDAFVSASTNGNARTKIIGPDGSVVNVTKHGDYYALVSHTPDMALITTVSGLNSQAVLDIHGMGSALVQVGGTWKGKIDIQGAIDSQWATLSIFQPTGQLVRTGINNDAQNGLYRIVITAGYTKIRAVFTTYTSGTATIQFNASNPVGTSQVFQLNQGNFLSTVYQPTGSNLHTYIDNPNLTVSGTTTISGGVIIKDLDNNYAPVVTGPFTGQKGLRVFGGPTDPISDIPVYMDFDHHQLHEGESFRWSVYVSSLALNANKDIRIVVPNITVPAGVPVVRVVPHLRFQVVASDTAQVFLNEGTTFTVNGTQRSLIALERNGTYSPKLQIWEDPTINVLGTQIWQGLLLGSKSSVGDTDHSDNEFALKNNTEYSFRVTSGASSNKVLIRLVLYEDLGV